MERRTITAYHRRLFRLWRLHAAAGLPGCDAMPYLGQAPLPCRLVDVVFLGITPSFHPKMLAKHWNEAHPNISEPMTPAPWQWDGDRSERSLQMLRRRLERLDQYSRSAYRPYYKLLDDVADAAGAKDRWHPLDVFPLRVSKQKLLESHLPFEGSWNPFLEQLFSAGIAVLRALRPKVVVVVNAYVANLLCARLSLQRQANGHRYDTPKVPGATFLLNGALNQGRTDVFARERLIADLRNVLAGKPGLS